MVNTDTGDEWIEVVGGKPGDRSVRSFRPDRVFPYQGLDQAGQVGGSGGARSARGARGARGARSAGRHQMPSLADAPQLDLG